ncbi:AAA family ATPase [Streptomyces sp. NPDC047082]|uniref:AAA family ATPase n=1 Tax=Streptomyces sp. NPDC047082 TaxID=3155259 RepID=UPI003406CCD0
MPRIGLRGREQMLVRIRGLLQRATTGCGRLLVLRGPTGSGRSTVLRAVADEARRRGMCVRQARCSAEESQTPLGVVRQLIGDGGGSGFGGQALPVGAWDELRAAVGQGPLLVAVDDVDLADEASRRWLAHLGRRVDLLPVLLVMTERHHYDVEGPMPPGAARGLAPELVVTEWLEPLPPEAVAALVQDRLGAVEAVSDVTPEAAMELCTSAGCGNPMLVHALLDDLCGPAARESFTEAVDWWLEAAGALTAHVARVVAELDGEDYVTAEILAEVAQADTTRVSGWLAAMRKEGFLAKACEPSGHPAPRFADPLLREAVLARWPARRRALVHLRTAEVLFRQNAPVDVVARHLLRAPAAGEEWAVETLVDASSQASREGRQPEAIALLRRSLAENLTDSRRGEVLTSLGCLEVRTDRNSGVRHLTEALRLQSGAHGRLRVANALGAALAAHGEVPAALDVLRRLAEGFGEREDLADVVHAAQAATALIASHELSGWRNLLPHVKHRARQAPPCTDPMAHSLLTEHEATAGLISAEETMQRVRSILAAPTDPGLQLYLLASLATLAQWADELDYADVLVERGLLLHQDHPLHPAQQCLLSVRTETAVMRGRYTQVAEAATGPDGHSANTHVRAQGVIALVELDRLADARRLASMIEAQGSRDSWEWIEFRYAQGLLHWAEDDPSGALRHLTACGDLQQARQTQSPVATPWRSAAAHCLLRLGRAAEALPLAEEELRLARIWGTSRLVGRALRAVGEARGGQHGLALLQDAVTLHRQSPAPPELAATMLVHGRALFAAGQPGRAREVLREAAALAERLGTIRLKRLADTAVRTVGGRQLRIHHTGVASLTTSERHVASLAAAGNGNAEIAALLHLARRTVETHLTNTYRKLGIRGRPQLSSALNEASHPERHP